MIIPAHLQPFHFAFVHDWEWKFRNSKLLQEVGSSSAKYRIPRGLVTAFKTKFQVYVQLQDLFFMLEKVTGAWG